jgi:hypothetical protein
MVNGGYTRDEAESVLKSRQSYRFSRQPVDGGGIYRSLTNERPPDRVAALRQ